MAVYFVRRADTSALDALTALEADIFSEAPWSREAIASHLNSSSGRAYLAVTAEGEPIGYLLGLSLGEEAELLRIGVIGRERGTGIGFNLLDYFLFDLKGAGTKACYLEVREHNYDAIDLYHKCEFKVTGRRKNYYKNPTEDALLMACDPI